MTQKLIVRLEMCLMEMDVRQRSQISYTLSITVVGIWFGVLANGV